MSESVRGIRHKTKGLLDAERKHADIEIEKIRKSNQEIIQKLEKEQEEALKEYQKQLEILQEKQARTIENAQKSIDNQLEAHEREIRVQILKLQQDTQRKIEKQRKIFEEELRSKYEEIDKRIQLLIRRQDNAEESEQILAKETVEKAQNRYKLICKNKDANIFQIDIISQVLAPMMKACIDAYNLQSWASATGKAMLTEIECKRCELDTINERKYWNNRENVVRDKIDALNLQLCELTKDNTVVEFAGECWEGCLASWNIEDSHYIEKELQRLNDSFSNITVGDIETLDTLDIDLSTILRNQIIERIVYDAYNGVIAFILAYKLIVCFEDVAGEDWIEADWCHIYMDPKSRHGGVVLEETNENDQMTVDAYIDQQSLKRGKIVIRMVVSYAGNSRDELLTKELNKKTQELFTRASQPEYGSLIKTMSTQYIDKNGRPAVSMEFQNSANLNIEDFREDFLGKGRTSSGSEDDSQDSDMKQIRETPQKGGTVE